MQEERDEDDALVIIKTTDYSKSNIKLLMKRMSEIASSSPPVGTVFLVRLLGVLEFTDKDKKILNKARKPVSVKFKKNNRKLGDFISLGDEVVIDAVPKVKVFGADVSLILAKTIKGDLQRSEGQLILTNIEGISAKLLLSTKVEEIVVTHDKIVIY